MTLLSVRDLSVTHDGSERPSPQRASFDVTPGEVVLVLGPSGSGKSTLALALNGLIPQAIPADVDGAVAVRGQDAATTPVARLSADVAMVFQDPDAQLVTGTVLDEVAFALENLLLPVEDVLARAETALRRVNLWERRDENPDRLSGGGRQRLAIACALAIGAPVIVLDEPTANLDPQGIDDVYAALADLVAVGDRSIVLVEHNLDAAMRFATRVLVLDREGRLAYDGPVDEVLRSRTEELLAMGVWLPSATLAGRMLRGRGILPADATLPLTPEELADALERVPHARLRSSGEDGAADRVEAPRSPGAPLIRTRGLAVRKGGREILHDVDLDFAPGSFTAIVGANGAGKTTLIQALAGVVPPPRGQVDIAGLDPATASPRQLTARVGFVFQNPEHQFIAHTVFDELAHGLRRTRVPDDEIAAQVGRMLTRFGLEHKAEVHPFLLSGGEKRRLSVGTALITRPDVLVLDEPTFGQDRARAEELLRLLDELRREGTTIVIVTHDLQLVAEHATHTVVLADGRVHAAGPTAEIFVREGLLEAAGLRLPALHRALTPAQRMLLAGGRFDSGALRAASLDEREDESRSSSEERSDESKRTESDKSDPYAAPAEASGWRFLHHLNPLAKIAAVLPAMLALVFVRDLATPAAFLVLGYALTLVGARITRRVAVLLAALPFAIAIIGVGFSLWVAPNAVADPTPLVTIGSWSLTSGALQVGLSTGLRLGAILLLALIGGITTTGPDLVRAGVQQLRVPYRIGYTALAAYRFVPRFGYELGVIRAAHRVRGHHGGAGPFSRLARGWGYIVPLLAGAIRHAERVALAMDARAFGAHPTRTERYVVPFRARDIVFIAAFIAASVALFVVLNPWQLF